MKLTHLTLTALAAGALSLTACDKDEEFTRAELVGTWNVTAMSSAGYYEFQGQRSDDFSESIDSSTATYTFNDDGTYAVMGAVRYTEVEYPGTDSAETETYVEILDEEGTFTVSGETVTLMEDDADENGESEVFQVADFASGSRLELESNVDGMENFFGIDMRVVATTNIVLEQ